MRAMPSDEGNAQMTTTKLTVEAIREALSRWQCDTELSRNDGEDWPKCRCGHFAHRDHECGDYDQHTTALKHCFECSDEIEEVARDYIAFLLAEVERLSSDRWDVSPERMEFLHAGITRMAKERNAAVDQLAAANERIAILESIIEYKKDERQEFVDELVIASERVRRESAAAAHWMTEANNEHNDNVRLRERIAELEHHLLPKAYKCGRCGEATSIYCLDCMEDMPVKEKR